MEDNNNNVEKDFCSDCKYRYGRYCQMFEVTFYPGVPVIDCKSKEQRGRRTNRDVFLNSLSNAALAELIMAVVGDKVEYIKDLKANNLVSAIVPPGALVPCRLCTQDCDGADCAINIESWLEKVVEDD